MKTTKQESIQSLGGKAAAKNMTAEQRSARASLAAAVRWNKPKAEYYGTLKLGDISISAAVLDDGRRIISHRSLALALNARGGGRYWERKKTIDAQGGAMLPEYVSAAYLSPFIDAATAQNLCQPIDYITKGGESAQGFEATILPEICDIWINADKNGTLNKPAQKATAAKTYELLKALSQVGIIALVDEATGYQRVREKDALAKILEAYLENVARKWELMFQLDYYREMYRLKGWEFVQGNSSRPGVIGTYTNDLIYQRLHPGILKKLNSLNPVNPTTGRRKKNHHLFFTGEVGLPELKEHLSNVIFLMKTCDTWPEFMCKLDRARPKVGATLQLPLTP